MILKIKMMSGQEIPLRNEEALQHLLSEANTGKKLVITEFGVVNVASIDSIVPHKEAIGAVAESIRYGHSLAEAEKDALGSSPFAKLLASKTPLLPENKK